MEKTVLSQFLQLATFNWLGSTILVVSAYLLLYKTPLRRLHVKNNYPTSEEMRRDFLYTSLAGFIHGGIGFLNYALWSGGFGNYYYAVEEYGWAYFIFSVAVMIIFYDAYFYWAHRFMHTTKWNRKIHRIHHLTRNPTPFSALGVHPFEAVILSFFGTVTAFFIPVHIYAVAIFSTISFVYSIYVHSGIELVPQKLRQHFLFDRFIYTTTRHSNHHKSPNHDYGLFFVFWDHYMGTASDQITEITVDEDSLGVPSSTLPGQKIS